MIDQQKAISAVMSFLQDESKKILLVRGYDNNAKVRVVLSCLNKEFRRGIIRTVNMKEIGTIINLAFNGKGKVMPDNVKSTKSYKVGDMLLSISSYVSSTKNNHTGNQNTFTWYHPVNSVLDNEKRYTYFLNELQECRSRKIILTTVTEWAIDKWDIENHVDEVFFYSVENDNPQIMENLRRSNSI
jgi:hypothetical protein